MWRKAEAWLVYAVTAALLVTAVAANVVWVKNVGIQEDWQMVGPWVGTDHDLLGWLWSLNNGHRTPLPRLIYLCLLWVTNDFRTGALLNQALLAGLALLLAHSTAKARGDGLRIADAVFPLALLHLGHWHNIEWGWQIQFVATTVLGGLLLSAMTGRSAPGRMEGWLAAGAIVLLPTTGLPGIVLALGMIPWLAIMTLFARGEPEHRPARWLMLGAIVVVLGYTGLYFIGWSPGWSPGHPELPRLLEATVEYFALAKGWPFLHPLDRAVGVAVLALSVYAIFLCAKAWLADRKDARAFGLANFIAVNAALGATVAYSRGTYYADFLNISYAIFAVLPLLASLIVVQLYGRPLFSRALLYAAVAAFLVILPYNISGGFVWRDWYVEGVAKYEADVASGLPLPEIADRNTGFLLHGCDGCLLPLLRNLRDAGIAPYNRLPAD